MKCVVDLFNKKIVTYLILSLSEFHFHVQVGLHTLLIKCKTSIVYMMTFRNCLSTFKKSLNCYNIDILYLWMMEVHYCLIPVS